ncbi:MAG: nucleotidyltransferase domain-containing protein [Spirochaetales bacterium]|jgi:predicted nucleotidyltransferase|nr:nucleotidyltransferase domain-containing protein [Spirochaetales bacterium]
MAVDIETVKRVVRQYISDVKDKMPIEKVYLYGSYAKGIQHEHSDVDVCFFSEYFASKRTWDILTELFYLKVKYDKQLLIEPYAFPTSEIYNDNPFVKEILRTGYEL